MKKIFLIAAIPLLFASCSSSKITDSYSIQNSNTPAKKILVLGLFSEKNRTAKRAMETELAKNLEKMGYETVTATEEYGPTAFRNMNEQQALAKLKENGFESVVTITLVNKDKQKRYVPGNYGYNPGFWNYYSYYSPWGYRPNYSPGYTETNTSYVFETNLYDVNNNQLMYSAESKTVDAGTMGNLANDYAKDIVRDMKRKNVFG